MKRYTVIVYPPPPAMREPTGVTYSTATPERAPKVINIMSARTPEQAAEQADVQPGGYAVVVTESRRFDRAAKAPLEERASDGAALPTTMKRAA